MIWDKKVFENAEHLLWKETGCPRGIRELVPSAREMAERDRNKAYLASCPKGFAVVVKTWFPYADDALYVCAKGTGQKSFQYSRCSLFECRWMDAVRRTELLFVYDIALADEDDVEFIQTVMRARGRNSRPTIIDANPECMAVALETYDALARVTE
jgi:hypothetical protein